MHFKGSEHCLNVTDFWPYEPRFPQGLEKKDQTRNGLPLKTSSDLNLYAATNRKYIRVRMRRRLGTGKLSLEME